MKIRDVIDNGSMPRNSLRRILKIRKLLIPGAAEQVKQVKQLLHRNSEVLLQRNF